MVGFLVVSHGDMAKGIKDSISMIMGDQEQFGAVGLYVDSDMERFQQEIYEAAVRLDNGDGVILFTDMFGASPCNFAAMNMQRFAEKGCRVEILTGVNLPMMLEGFAKRMESCALDEIKGACLDCGREGIQDFMRICADMDDED